MFIFVTKPSHRIHKAKLRNVLLIIRFELKEYFKLTLKPQRVGENCSESMARTNIKTYHKKHKKRFFFAEAESKIHFCLCTQNPQEEIVKTSVFYRINCVELVWLNLTRFLSKKNVTFELKMNET